MKLPPGNVNTEETHNFNDTIYVMMTYMKMK